jgi:hypothetical protein
VIYALAAGLIIGALLTWLVHRDELTYLRSELRVAHAQIAHAVMADGAVIPPRAEEVEPPKPLPGPLVEIVNEWESAESRMVEEHRIRGWLAEGWGVGAILRQYNANGEES